MRLLPKLVATVRLSTVANLRVSRFAAQLIRELNELCALNCTSENVFSFSSVLEKRIRRIFKEITHVSCSVLLQLPAASVIVG